MDAKPIKQEHVDFLDEHFGVTPDWKSFRKKLKGRTFQDTVVQDTRSDPKLRRFAKNVGMRESSKRLGTLVPSEKTKRSYKVKYHPQSKRFSCTCPDWTYNRSVRVHKRNHDCKHIQNLRGNVKESLKGGTKLAEDRALLLGKAASVLLKEAKIKSNDPMPPRTKKNVDEFLNSIEGMDSPHKEEVKKFIGDVPPKDLFEILHSMRRWYSGGTMHHLLDKHNDKLKKVMDLDPKNIKGVRRGFKVSTKDPLAKVSPGQKLDLPVTRNRGVSSWTGDPKIPHKFSGKSKGRVGLIVELDDDKVKPLLAPPEKTAPWFNHLYEHAIGTSFRPKEREYVIKAPKLNAKVVEVKGGRRK